MNHAALLSFSLVINQTSDCIHYWQTFSVARIVRQHFLKQHKLVQMKGKPERRDTLHHMCRKRNVWNVPCIHLCLWGLHVGIYAHVHKHFHTHANTNKAAHKQNTESQCLKTKAVLRNKRRPKKPSRHPQQAPIVINENKYWERVGHRHRETAQTMEQTA